MKKKTSKKKTTKATVSSSVTPGTGFDKTLKLTYTNKTTDEYACSGIVYTKDTLNVQTENGGVSIPVENIDTFTI